MCKRLSLNSQAGIEHLCLATLAALLLATSLLALFGIRKSFKHAQPVSGAFLAGHSLFSAALRHSRPRG